MFVDWHVDPFEEEDRMDNETAAQILTANIGQAVAALLPINPYHVPESERIDNDEDDPDSVADRAGADLSMVDPDAGEVIDLTAMAD